MKALLALAALALAAAGVRAAPVQVTSLIGAEVIDPHGKELGVIEDLAIDMRGASVHYAILSTGSRVLFERSLHAVRLQALRPGLDRRQLVLDLDASRASSAPADAAPNEVRLLRAKSILGREVRYADGGPAGTIRNLVVELDTARVEYALLRSPEGEARLEVPLGALRLPPASQAAILLAQ